MTGDSDQKSTGSGRFQPGRSGNPKGRPRKASAPAELLKKALDVKVTVNGPNGRRIKISKGEAAATQWANQSASGNLIAARSSFDFIERSQERSGRAPAAQTEVLAEEDAEIYEALIAQMRLVARSEEP